MVVDSSAAVSRSIWHKIKDFLVKFTSHLRLSDEGVQVSLTSFGDKAKLEVTRDSFDDVTQLHEFISNLPKVDGKYRLDLAFELADKLTSTVGQSRQKHAVLFVTEATDEEYNKVVVNERAKAMKLRGVDISTMLLLKGSISVVDQYTSVVSQPIAKHFFIVKQSQELPKWSTVASRAVCRNVF